MEDTRQRLTRELEEIKKEPKEQRLAWYFDMLKLPSGQRLGSQWVEDALGITDLDTREYQVQKEKEVSMPASEKRKRIVREIVKPLLKEAGFRTKGQDWWRELEDGWLLVHMKSSQFNGPSTGCNFQFDFSASTYEEIQGDITKQWIYHQMCDLSHCDFLPYAGMLSPYYGARDYHIDGYENYLPKDEPLERIMAQVQSDFEDFILPQLQKVHSVADWRKLYEEKQTLRQGREIMLLGFYHSVCMGASMGSKTSLMEWYQKEHGLTPEEVLSHLDWLETICKYSSWPNEDRVSEVKDIIQSLNTKRQE